MSIWSKLFRSAATIRKTETKNGIAKVYYSADKGYIIGAMAKVKDAGYLALMEPVVVMDKNTSMEDLGVQIRACLEKARNAAPVECKEYKFWQILGYKGFASFSKHFGSVTILEEADLLKAILWERQANGAYSYPKNKEAPQWKIDIPDAELGSRVVEMFLPKDSLKKPDIDFDFGRKSIWIAVKDIPLDSLLSFHNISNIEKTSWEQGLQIVEDDWNKIFISGPYHGWTILICNAFPDITNSQEVIDLLKELCGGEKEICYFISHRTVDVYGFARMVQGETERMYGYSGEHGHVYVNIGDQSLAEQQLLLDFPENDEALAAEDCQYISEEDVLMIAAKWCVEDMKINSAKKKNCYVGEWCGQTAKDSLVEKRKENGKCQL